MPPINADFDGAWKEALDSYLPQFLELCFPNVYHAVDWSRGFRSHDT